MRLLLKTACAALIIGVSAAPSMGLAKTLRWQLDPQQQFRVAVSWTNRNLTSNLELTNTTSLQLLWVVKGVDAEGVYEIAQTMTQVKHTLQTPDGKTFQYDSQEAGDAKGSAAFLASYWKPLLSVERTFKMTAQGRILEAEEPNAVNASDNALISRTFGQEAWRAILGRGYVVFPMDAIEPNQTWNEVQTVALPFDQSTLKATHIFSYRGEQAAEPPGSDKILDLIDVTTQFATEPSDDEPAKLRIVKQDSTGELVFEAAAGHPARSRYNQSLTLRWVIDDDNRIEMQTTSSFEMTFQPVPQSEIVAVEEGA